jgi:hypothetical protein
MGRITIAAARYTTITVRCVCCQNRIGLNGARSIGASVCCVRCLLAAPPVEVLPLAAGGGSVEIVG